MKWSEAMRQPRARITYVCDNDGLRADRATTNVCIYFAVTVSLCFFFSLRFVLCLLYFPFLLLICYVLLLCECWQGEEGKKIIKYRE